MSVFAIVSLHGQELLKEAVERSYAPEARHQYTDETWLVSDEASTREISSKLGLRGGALGASGVVFKIDAYAGHTEPTLWDWLKTHPGATSDG